MKQNNVEKVKKQILSADEPCVELDGYRLPDGDPVLVIGSENFRFANSSQPWEQMEIYKQASKLVDLISEYKNEETEIVLNSFKVKRKPNKVVKDNDAWFHEGDIRTCYVKTTTKSLGWYYVVPLNADESGVKITFLNKEHLEQTFEIME